MDSNAEISLRDATEDDIPLMVSMFNPSPLDERSPIREWRQGTRIRMITLWLPWAWIVKCEHSVGFTTTDLGNPNRTSRIEVIGEAAVVTYVAGRIRHVSAPRLPEGIAV